MRKKFLKNKKGDISITILVIGIIVVCFMALISFYLAEMSTSTSFDFIGKITKVSSSMENYQAGNSVEFHSDLIGKYLYEEISVRSGFLWLGKKTIFSIKYYSP